MSARQFLARRRRRSENLPLVGGLLSDNWEAISQHVNGYVAHFKADIEEWLLWGLQEVENVGLFIFEIGFAVILAGVFLANRHRRLGLRHRPSSTGSAAASPPTSSTRRW